VSGIAIAKNFRQEASIFKEFDGANTQSFRVNIKRGLVLALYFHLNALGGVGSALWSMGE
jgi:ATP-binding cassette subfamily B protein